MRRRLQDEQAFLGNSYPQFLAWAKTGGAKSPLGEGGASAGVEANLPAGRIGIQGEIHPIIVAQVGRKSNRGTLCVIEKG
jgi:hypothetical protein